MPKLLMREQEYAVELEVSQIRIGNKSTIQILKKIMIDQEESLEYIQRLYRRTEYLRTETNHISQRMSDLNRHVTQLEQVSRTKFASSTVGRT